MKNMTTRRHFLASTAATALAAAGCSTTIAETVGSTTSNRGIRVRFLGSGAAGWKSEWAKNPHMRRQSSLLLENKVMIDCTMCAFDKMPAGCRPEALFQTHSHGDHYNPSAAVKSGVKRMYVQETWSAAARKEVAEAAAKLNLPAPEVIALPFGKAVEESGMRFTGVPANHSTSRVTDGVLERTSLYLVEKGPSRLLYATDTGGIPGDAARMIGIDPHVTPGTKKKPFTDNPYVHAAEPITAFIMEATNGANDDDFRIFVHSSVQTVARIANMLKRTKRLVLPPGQSVMLTHLAVKYRSWPSEKINAELPEGLRAAYDGLELLLG
ncbi:MAG: hypothetical protein IJ146_05440 [Kiritimatiellae bacterium]|nr:hypothetical protein [Kiritimatiellia bacterium]